MVERKEVSQFFLYQTQQLENSVQFLQEELDSILRFVKEKESVLAIEKERLELLKETEATFNRVFFPSDSISASFCSLMNLKSLMLG